MSAKPIDMVGLRFGRLVVVMRAGSTPVRGTKPVRGAQWHCACDCGKSSIVHGDRLRKGTSASCGCLAREASGKRVATHRMTNTVEFNAWQGMKARCRNPRSCNYPNYGARGILVCDAWFESFEVFLADVGMRPSKGLSIDRIDNNGNYEPGNVKWSTATEQVHNRRPLRPRKRRASLAAEAAP